MTEQMIDTPPEFPAFVSLMETCSGPENAKTIHKIQLALGHSTRRQTEKFLELFLGAVPFPLVSGPTGYYRPTAVDEINHYLNSLRSRIRCLAIRARSVRRSARAAGWQRSGRLFSDADPQQLLQFHMEDKP